MSKIEALATHDRDMEWFTKHGTKRLRDLEDGHIRNIIMHLERKLRRSSGYQPTHPNRKHEGRSNYYLEQMKLELAWRGRNGC